MRLNCCVGIKGFGIGKLVLYDSKKNIHTVDDAFTAFEEILKKELSSIEKHNVRIARYNYIYHLLFDWDSPKFGEIKIWTPALFAELQGSVSRGELTIQSFQPVPSCDLEYIRRNDFSYYEVLIQVGQNSRTTYMHHQCPTCPSVPGITLGNTYALAVRC